MSDGRSRVIVVRGGRAPSGPNAIAPLFQAPAALFQPPAINLGSENLAKPPVSPASTRRAASAAQQ
jgi:hypothetical protein